MPFLSPQPAAKLSTDSVVAIPIVLAMNSRRSMFLRRAFSSQRSRIIWRNFRSRSPCGMKNSPFERLPSHTGVSYGISDSVFLRFLIQFSLILPIDHLGFAWWSCYPQRSCYHCPRVHSECAHIPQRHGVAQGGALALRAKFGISNHSFVETFGCVLVRGEFE